MTTKLEIPADVVPHRMVLYTAGLHGRAHPGEFPSQPVENSFDAGATDVWVVLKGGKHPSLTVIDNGSGMLPDILPEDHKRLEKHLADLRDPEKEIPEDFDIFKEISEASLHSLMWMIRYIGLSPHVKGEDPYLMALLGIETGVLEKLTPGVVSAYLSGRFGKVLREKAVRLTIIDQVTEAGISEPDGIEIPVRAPVYD